GKNNSRLAKRSLLPKRATFVSVGQNVAKPNRWGSQIARTGLPSRHSVPEPEKLDPTSTPQYAPDACEQKVKYQKANDANRNENDAEQNDQFHGCQRQHHYAALEK